MSLIVLTNHDDWTCCMREVAHLDISYTKEYVSLYAEREGGVPEAVFFSAGEERIFYPYVVRSLDSFLPGYSDIVSIGYGGPSLCSKQSVVQSFSAQFHVYCQSKKYVTETVRFHPLLKNAELFRDQMQLDLVRETIAVDVRPALAQIQAQYSQNVRRNMKKAKDHAVRIVEGKAIMTSRLSFRCIARRWSAIALAPPTIMTIRFLPDCCRKRRCASRDCCWRFTMTSR